MPLGTKTFHRRPDIFHFWRTEPSGFWRALRIRLNLPPFFGVKESDFRFYILYQCTIRTNSSSAPVSKHSDETAPNPLEHRLLTAILLNDTLHSLAANVMRFNLHTCLWSRVCTFAASFIRAFMASLLLAALVVQTKGIKFYNLQTSGACRGEHVSLVR